MTNAEKHVIQKTIIRIDNLLLDDWLKKSKTWLKRWSKKND